MAATRRTRRDLWLAAVFLWITPRAAALSIRLTARRSCSTLSSVPLTADVTAFLVRVRSSARTDLLRRRRFSFWRFRLIWLAILATWASSILSDGLQEGAVGARQRTDAGGNHSRSGHQFPQRPPPGARSAGRRWARAGVHATGTGRPWPALWRRVGSGRVGRLARD